MTLDRWISTFFLTFSLVYGYGSWTYPLLPFERNMAFLPNTMPTVLAAAGIILALILLFSKAEATAATTSSDDISIANLKQYKTGQAVALLVAMVLYALLIRPLGFIPSTVLFLVGSGWVLGERKLHVMIPVALVGTLSIWYVVQEVLGIFLKPLPAFLG